MRCMLIAVLNQLPEAIQNSQSEQLQKMVQNHEKLMSEKGTYYLVFHIEMKQHFGTQDKVGWKAGDQEWQLYAIHSWPL